jgi:mannose-1-phosphate guanylyltransferase
MEEHTEIFNEIRKELKKDLHGKELSQIVKPYFEKFEKISVDFGIMEYSKNIRVIPVDIDWNDIGSFNAFDEIFPKDENGNVVKGQKIKNLDSKDNIVISDDIKISLLGVSDLVVVKEKDKLLITRKDRTQDIKKILKSN